LAPVQVCIASISEKSADYASNVQNKLSAAGMRVELDNSPEKIGPKKHAARKQKIPYIIVVGEKEAAEGTVNINDRTGRNLGTVPIDDFISRCQKEIEERAVDVTASS
jgi:threonyl-tRNA synthetase